jgi:hypothetical protein
MPFLQMADRHPRLSALAILQDRYESDRGVDDLHHPVQGATGLERPGLTHLHPRSLWIFRLLYRIRPVFMRSWHVEIHRDGIKNALGDMRSTEYPAVPAHGDRDLSPELRDQQEDPHGHRGLLVPGPNRNVSTAAQPALDAKRHLDHDEET